MGFSTPKPPAIPLPPPAAHPAVLGSSLTALAGKQTKQNASQAEGRGLGGTVQTSPQGLEKPATAKATLLG